MEFLFSPPLRVISGRAHFKKKSVLGREKTEVAKKIKKGEREN